MMIMDHSIGAHGQRALMSANILLVGADAAGTETLKNLVLPGVGRFSVLDDTIVDADRDGNNFFVHPTDRGLPRAQIVTALLTEMNTDVHVR
jgi:amyloid beta precursor protein binding protein 1